MTNRDRSTVPVGIARLTMPTERTLGDTRARRRAPACTLALFASFALSIAPPARALAQSRNQQAQDIREMRQEIDSLKQEIRELKAAQQTQATAPQPASSTAASAAPTSGAPASTVSGSPHAAVPVTVTKEGVQVGPVNVKVGGFIEAAGIYRNRNEVADVGSDYNQGIPFKSSPLAHESETRFSARQSRLSLLTSADVNPQTHLAAYYEMDFLASGVTSNSRESFSYTPRSRHLYATLDKDDWGFHVLGGQNWSLLTTNGKGILPRTEQIPLTIDAQYVEGFNWLRVPQFRVVEDFGHGIWAGISAESPQIVTSPITTPSSGVNYTNNGNAAGLLNNSTTYSNDYVPDFIGKVAFDPGWGHYEIKGLLRTFAVRSAHENRDTTGWGVGGAARLPLLPDRLELQLSGLAGSGIGRYGSGQLPDAAFQSNLLDLVAVNEWQGLVGIIGHPWAGNDLYVYGGWEHADRAGAKGVFTDSNTGKFTGAPGYGSPNLDVSACGTEGGTCQAQTNDLKQITGGFWQDVYKGDYGRFTIGFQGGEIWRDAFSGKGGKPSTNVAIFMTSLRYYP